MIDPITIAEVLKKDRDGSAYTEIHKRLQEVDRLEKENERLRNLYKGNIRFEYLLEYLYTLERVTDLTFVESWYKPTGFGVISIGPRIFTFFSTRKDGGYRELFEASRDILKTLKKQEKSDDFNLFKIRLKEWKDKIDERVQENGDVIAIRDEIDKHKKELEEYKQKIERAETTLQKHNLYKIKNMGFWGRLKWVFKGD